MSRFLIPPDPLNSDTEFNRYYNNDLVYMEIEDLLCELCSARFQLWLLKTDRSSRILGPFEQGRRIKWYRERISRLEAELRERRYATQGIKSQPKVVRGVIL